MAATIHVEPDLAHEIGEVLSSRDFPFELGNAERAALRVVRGDRSTQSDGQSLFAGGWIACPDALALAERLGVPARKLGELLDLLDVKVRRCSLGCFP